MEITLKPIIPKRIKFHIRGISPLIQHAWTDKGLKMMRMTAAERKKQLKVARDPEAEAMAAAYKTDDGEFGIPLLAFKSALISAAHKDLGFEKTLLRKSFFIPADNASGIVPIQYDELVIREDIVKVGMNKTDIRYRPEFRGWSASITAEIDSDLLTEQDVVNLVNRAGFSIGIGEWRPEKGGEFGRFCLDTTQPIELEEVT